ncbi:MAG: hypothetical protein ACK5SI_04660, partial [Planctomycetia bacterium]
MPERPRAPASLPPPSRHDPPRWRLRRPISSPWLSVVVVVLATTAAAVRAADGPAGALADLPARGIAAAIAEAGRIEVPAVEPGARLVVQATQASRWTEGAYDVWHLTGGVRIVQGSTEVSGHEAVVWIEEGSGRMPDDERSEPAPRTVLVRMAGDVRVRSGAGGPGEAVVRGPRWAGRFWMLHDPDLKFASVVAAAGRPAIYESPADPPARASVPAAAGEPIQQAQFSEFAAPAGPPVAAAGGRRLRAFPRSSVPLDLAWYPSPAGDGWIGVITSGVNLVVDGVAVADQPVGTLDISTDRLVIWTRGSAQPDLSGGAAQEGRVPLELYMEGNVIFRQGQRVVEAASMFYDVPNERGVITGGTVLTPVPNYAGAARLRADFIRQVDRSRFVASRTGATTSRLGVPSWEIRSREMEFTDVQVPVPGPFGQPEIDPTTGEPRIEHEQMITSRGNTVTLGGVPVLWWPVLATNAKKPTFYINNAQYKRDRIFGRQILTSWDAFQVFGWRRPPDGVDWNFDVNYLSLRGPGGGTSLLYNRPDFLGLGTPASGDLDAQFVGDVGRDNVGLYRRDLTYPGFPDRTFRGRSFWRHRQDLGGTTESFFGGWQARGTAGWISDMNFLEQYYEVEWEEGYEQRTWV